MRFPKETGQIIDELVKHKLKPTEYRVFLSWLTDSCTFHPSGNVIAERTGIRREHVSRALKGLTDKGILKKTGKKKLNSGHYVSKYDLDTNFFTPSTNQTKAPSKNKTTVKTENKKPMYGNMSEEEYRLQREYANQFPVLDWENIDIKPIDESGIE